MSVEHFSENLRSKREQEEQRIQQRESRAKSATKKQTDGADLARSAAGFQFIRIENSLSKLLNLILLSKQRRSSVPSSWIKRARILQMQKSRLQIPTLTALNSSFCPGCIFEVSLPSSESRLPDECDMGSSCEFDVDSFLKGIAEQCRMKQEENDRKSAQFESYVRIQRNRRNRLRRSRRKTLRKKNALNEARGDDSASVLRSSALVSNVLSHDHSSVENQVQMASSTCLSHLEGENEVFALFLWRLCLTIVCLLNALGGCDEPREEDFASEGFDLNPERTEFRSPVISNLSIISDVTTPWCSFLADAYDLEIKECGVRYGVPLAVLVALSSFPAVIIILSSAVSIKGYPSPNDELGQLLRHELCDQMRSQRRHPPRRQLNHCAPPKLYELVVWGWLAIILLFCRPIFCTPDGMDGQQSVRGMLSTGVQSIFGVGIMAGTVAVAALCSVASRASQVCFARQDHSVPYATERETKVPCFCLTNSHPRVSIILVVAMSNRLRAASLRKATFKTILLVNAALRTMMLP